jgi:deoxyribonuclease IV
LTKPLLLGYHVSIKDSLELSFDRALEIGCTAFQIFTRNPRGWGFKPLTDEQVEKFNSKRRETGLDWVVAHMPYLPNLASPEAATMKKSRHALNEEAKRCDRLGIEYMVAHLGSHMGKGPSTGVRNVADACTGALEGSENTVVLLENMAGQKNSVGASFEELARIMEMVRDEKRMGVCFDTCHAYASGFDLAGEAAVASTMGLFDDIIGFDRLKVVHLNDSKGPLGSHLDRHEYIGEGSIGRKGLKAFLRYPGITERPLIMETPYDEERDPKVDMKLVKTLAG